MPVKTVRAQVVELNAARAELPEGEGSPDVALSRAQDALRAAADEHLRENADAAGDGERS